MSDLTNFDPIDNITEVDDLRELLREQNAEIAQLREALEYMLRAWDREVGSDNDILLMVKGGAKIRSVQCARKALEQKP